LGHGCRRVHYLTCTTTVFPTTVASAFAVAATRRLQEPLCVAGRSSYTRPHTNDNGRPHMPPAPNAAPVKPRASLLAIIGPGLLLAATGVGSGDLATASIVGGMLGVGVLWAVLVGAFLKFVVTEGLARWQLASGETLLEGMVRRLGPIVVWLFLPYLLLWSFFVGSAQ